MREPPSQEDVEWAKEQSQSQAQYDKENLKKEVWDAYIAGTFVLDCRSCVYGKVMAFVPAGTDPTPWDLWSRIFKYFGVSPGGPWRVTWFASQKKRTLPLDLIPLGPEHINGGYAFPCRPNTIVIYREEEATRVLIHELLHAACTDRALPIEEMEAETEAWAEILLVAILAEGSEKKAQALWAAQAKWVADQNRQLEVKYGVKGPEDYVWRYTCARKAAYLRLGLELPEGDLTAERSNRLTTSRLKIV
jgi:hypothetical protein